ncbi:phosphomannomutase/phosphoglucomutase [bacterium]|jgi:phosphomannomutase / phosphoglucomutase|nr:phosphomannomutase/phosphoglucomutase [bacterium]MBT6832094.1 phosphomannomutase/phosphoglucomutase [bacterium]MBT6995875.1 phosphomannomutase/phosphoglucomutase [bacterium]MBT7772600.1 phosphomannomutase/phosphoglucomutase [bacterium]
MKLNSKIFRAYDIRGEAFVDFDEDGFFVIARAFGQHISEKFGIEKPRIFVSGDGRNSMAALWPAVIAGLEAAGAETVWGGILPTPVNYFALHAGTFDATIQISASHNPPADNGLKLTARRGAVCGDEILEIQKRAECLECPGAKTFGTCANGCEKIDFFEKYVEKIRKITPAQTARKLVVDAGNGVAGIFYPEVLKKFEHEIVELFCDLDPNFPNHQPDPERPENLQDLIAAVKNSGAEFGLAFDGDGDRLGVVQKNGTILSADKILFVLAADFLSRNPGAPIVVDAMSSALLAEKIREIGGHPIRSKTGHSFIEEAMHAHDARLGGEQSGHFMIGENFYGHDDACLAALRFLAAVEKFPALLHEITVRWPDLLEFSEKISVPDEHKFEILEKVRAELSKKFKNLDTTDGVRWDGENGEWWIIRCSNTSPKIAIRIEARDAKSLDEKKSLLVKLVEKFAK